MTIPVMSPRLEVLTTLNITNVNHGIGIFNYNVATMSNGKQYTYPLFVQSPPYSKFAVLFEEEGERTEQVITAIRID